MHGGAVVTVAEAAEWVQHARLAGPGGTEQITPPTLTLPPPRVT